MAFALLKSTAFILGDFWTRAIAEQSRQNDISLSERALSLGGSRHIGLEGTGAQDAADYINLRLNGSRLSGFTVRARVEVLTEAAGTSVTPRIYDVTAAAVLATGTASTSTAWAEQVITLTLPSADRQFRLQLVKSNADARVFGIGVIEILAP